MLANCVVWPSALPIIRLYCNAIETVRADHRARRALVWKCVALYTINGPPRLATGFTPTYSTRAAARGRPSTDAGKPRGRLAVFPARGICARRRGRDSRKHILSSTCTAWRLSLVCSKNTSPPIVPCKTIAPIFESSERGDLSWSAISANSPCSKATTS
jgi:hypothetical protein